MAPEAPESIVVLALRFDENDLLVEKIEQVVSPKIVRFHESPEEVYDVVEDHPGTASTRRR